MAFTGASDLLTQLQTQIAACASWSGGSSAVHYPDLAWGAGPTLPCCTVAEGSRTSSTYAAGAAGLRGGSFVITIYTSGTVGATEILGQAILEELLAQPAGIPFRSGSVGLCGQSTDAQEAAGMTVNGIELNIEYGLDV